MEIQTRRVPLDTYTHAFQCECGWTSEGCPNGEATAGAALVRHMVEHYTEGK
jgi:hypothetical protein